MKSNVKNVNVWGLALCLTLAMGCSSVNSTDVKSVDEAFGEAAEAVAVIYDVSALKGAITKSGSSVLGCEGKDSEKFYNIRYPSSLRGVPVEDMEVAMERLRDNLPQHGWEIKKYGRDTSRAQNLEIWADLAEKKFSVHITLADRRERPSYGPSMILVTLGSACFQVPEGETVR